MNKYSSFNRRAKTGLLVALANGDVRLYNSERELLHVLKTGEPIAALRFGPYAREDGALAIITTSGRWPYNTSSSGRTLAT